jgi:hypothetical protein
MTKMKNAAKSPLTLITVSELARTALLLTARSFLRRRDSTGNYAHMPVAIGALGPRTIYRDRDNYDGGEGRAKLGFTKKRKTYIGTGPIYLEVPASSFLLLSRQFRLRSNP